MEGQALFAFNQGEVCTCPSRAIKAGRETHKMMLDHYQQTKNLLVSYSPKGLGFF